MLTDGQGYRIVRADTATSRRRAGQWLPRKPTKLVLRSGGWEYLVDWRPWHGLWVQSVRREAHPREPWSDTWEREEKRTMRRLKLAEGDSGPVPAASSESKLLGRMKLVLEHCTATAYDDGAPRTPGYLWVKTSGTTWIVTLFDPDGGARLDCRASTLDEAFALGEKWLSAEDAPWEIDEYLRERQAKKVKKKRA